MKKTKTFLEKIITLFASKFSLLNKFISKKIEKLEEDEDKINMKTIMFLDSSLERSLMLFEYAKTLLEEKIKQEEEFMDKQNAMIRRFKDYSE